MDIMEKDKDPLDQAITMLWSDYSDIDYWVRDMSMKAGSDVSIPKHVLKMAMKHLRDDLYKCHSIMCKIQEEREREKVG